MKVLLLGVIYKGVEKFLDDYFCSIDKQTYNNFDTLIIEDEFKLPVKYFRDRLICIEVVNKSIAEIRSIGINYAKTNNYDLIIFTDCDDFYSPNRVEIIVYLIINSDFVVNRIIPVDSFGKTLELQSNIDTNFYNKLSFNGIIEKNYFGLSNTAIKVNSLPIDFYLPKDIIAVDWWLYSFMLVNKRIFQYSDKAFTYYRQHTSNLVGAINDLDEKKLINGLNIKLIHYKYLAEYLMKFGKEYEFELLSIISIYDDLKTKLLDKDFLRSYLLKKEKLSKKVFDGWWGDIN